MICPKCEYEYIETVQACPDCGSKLVSAEDFEGNLVHHSDWCVACTCGNNIEAEMMKTNLESGGIEALVFSQSDRSFPVDGNLTIVKVLVQKTDSDEASIIINDILNNSSSDSN
jgi:hypothetical protein